VTKKKKVTEASSFTLPLMPPIVFGGACTFLLYSAIMGGPLDNPWARRYLMGHWVCFGTVALFLISSWALILKAILAARQHRWINLSIESLRTLVAGPDQVEASNRSKWLLKLWASQPESIRYSWFGQRIETVVRKQAMRTSGFNLDTDLKDIAQQDSDRQYESYGLVRIAIWAMPMLGFLGTVLGISATLGAMDTKALAEQSDKVMNQLTAGLYVAFDTTALALVLTVIAMYVQFAVQKLETAILNRIDHTSSECLMGFLVTAEQAETEAVEVHWRQLSTELVSAVQKIVEQQAELWKQTIQAAHLQWANLTGAAGDQIQQALGESIRDAMETHAQRMSEVQREGAEQLESRWQQWQIVLSDQTRAIHGQQKEMAKQAELLQKLVHSGDALHRLEEDLNSNIQQLSQVDRFHEAAICMTEAVAVLATQLERSGLLDPRRTAVERKGKAA
jgi:biopolymer transport protein ExbB/TolQ